MGAERSRRALNEDSTQNLIPKNHNGRYKRRKSKQGNIIQAKYGGGGMKQVRLKKKLMAEPNNRLV